MVDVVAERRDKQIGLARSFELLRRNLELLYRLRKIA